jgi:nucleoside-diphosphate-sugar epimerase
MYHLIHVEDLTDAILLAATAPKAPGQAFIIGNDKPIPIAGIAAIVADTLGKSHRVLRLPITPFFWAADLCEAVCRPLRIEPPIYRRRVAFYTRHTKDAHRAGIHPAFRKQRRYRRNRPLVRGSGLAADLSSV